MSQLPGEGVAPSSMRLATSAGPPVLQQSRTLKSLPDFVNDAFPDHRSAPPSELESASEWEITGAKGPRHTAGNDRLQPNCIPARQLASRRFRLLRASLLCMNARNRNRL